jgi:hypothetical protein
MHKHPQASINNSNLAKLFYVSWDKCSIVDNTLKGFKCTELYPYNPKLLSGDKFLPFIHYTKGYPKSATCTSAILYQKMVALASVDPSSADPKTSYQAQENMPFNT